MATERGESRKVLIVEPDELHMNVFAEEFARAGFAVLKAETGKQARRHYDRERPCLVLSALVRGEVGTRELVRYIRSSEGGADVPVILLSSGAKDVAHPGDAILRYDADFYFQKPAASDRVIWKARELLDGPRAVGLLDAEGEVVWGKRPVGFEDNLPLKSGELDEEMDVATLIYSFELHHRSGKLLLISGRTVRQLYFHRGWPVFAESNEASESLGAYLISLGKLTEEQLEQASALWKDIDRSLGVTLISEGMVGAADLLRAHRANVLRIFDGAFAQSEGQYYLERTEGLDAPETASLRESAGELVRQGITRHYSRARVKTVLGTARGQLAAGENVEHIVAGLGDAELGAVLERFRTRLPFPMLRKQPYFNARRRAETLVLWTVGALVEKPVSEEALEKAREIARWAREKPAGDASEPSSAPSRPRRTPRRAPSRAGRSSGSRSGAVKPRARRVEAPPPRRARGGDIMAAITEASAEASFRSGLSALRAGNYDAAVPDLESAVRAEPDRAEFHQALGRAIAQARDPGLQDVRRAVDALKKAISLEPRIGEHYHYLAVTLMDAGHTEEARVTFRRAIQLGGSQEENSRMLLNQLRGS